VVKKFKRTSKSYQAYISFMLSYAKSVLGLDTEALVKEMALIVMSLFLEKDFLL
jgi:hypothetical protein